MQIEAQTMGEALNHPAIKAPATQRGALVRAAVVDGEQLSIDVELRQAFVFEFEQRTATGLRVFPGRYGDAPSHAGCRSSSLSLIAWFMAASSAWAGCAPMTVIRRSN